MQNIAHYNGIDFIVGTAFIDSPDDGTYHIDAKNRYGEVVYIATYYDKATAERWLACFNNSGN